MTGDGDDSRAAPIDDASYTRIAADFHARIDCIAGAVDVLAPGIHKAATLLTQAVLEDRKIIVCADVSDAALADALAQALRSGRNGSPALPALALAGSTHADASVDLWTDLRTLARDGDVLLCIDTREQAPFAAACATFAERRNLAAVTLSDRDGSDAVVAVTLRADTRELRSELLLMACHCLQAEIRHLLLGE